MWPRKFGYFYHLNQMNQSFYYFLINNVSKYGLINNYLFFILIIKYNILFINAKRTSCFNYWKNGREAAENVEIFLFICLSEKRNSYQKCLQRLRLICHRVLKHKKSWNHRLKTIRFQKIALKLISKTANLSIYI